jgi:mitochondrial fission protein ELM1
METGVWKIWVITDGRAGNAAQALGVAEALARPVPAEIVARTIAFRPLFDRLPQALLAVLPARWLLRALTDRRALTGAEGANLVISAGRRGAVVASALRTVYKVPAAAILNPQMPLSRFDAVIVPAHDRLSGPNVIETIGAPNRLTSALIRSAADDLNPDWRPPKALAVMIGGPSKSARFDRPAMQRLLDDVARFDAAGWAILAVASRRTPDWAAPLLRERFPEARVWTGDGPNPYPGVLGAAAAAMVTEDSVNMASEAATTGLPVFVSGLGRIDDKFRRFHAALAERGCARPAADGPADWRYEPLAEADRVAALLVDRLGL